jgi:tetratricopeptide (TPR) repeat protein
VTSRVVAQTSDARKAEADRLFQQGLQQGQTSQFQAALESFHQALAIYREIGDRQREGRTLSNLAEVYLLLGNSAKTIEYLQQSLPLLREIGDRLGEARSLGSLGNAYLLLGSYAQAIAYHQQSLLLLREIGDQQGEWWSLGNLGRAYRSLGDYAKAIDYHQQSLAIAREIGDRAGEGAVLESLGNAYHNLGDYAKAIEYYQQSLAITRDIGNRAGEGAALESLGHAYHSLGDYAKAIEYYQQSLAIARDIGARAGEGAALESLGNAYHNLRDYAKAIESHQQSLAIARDIGNRAGEGNTLANLGNVYHNLGDYTKAIEYHQQSLTIARDISDPDAEGKVLNNLGVAFLGSGNLQEAERVLSTGIAKWEEIRNKLGKNDAFKVSIFEEQARTYLLLQKVLIAQKKTDKALETAERGRTRAFVELLTRRLSSQSDTPPPIQHPSFEDIKNISQQQNATIVEYSIVNFRDIEKSELFIWVISPNGKVTFRSFDLQSFGVTTRGSALRKLVTETLESLGVGEDRNGIFEVSITNPVADPQRQTKSLKQLHQLLIQPIADLLPTDPNERVIFIPHQDLFRVPFPALMDSDGKYLVEKHTILTAPSIQVLELTHKARQNGSRSGQGVLVVGNPSPMPKGFQPLKGAEKEALDVAQLLKTKPLIGSQATELAVLQQLPNARIIHLATPRHFNEQQPLLGGIALAQTGKDTQNDGLLTAEEIFNLKSKLSAELLV